jgi:flagellar biosynthesis protein FliQ
MSAVVTELFREGVRNFLVISTVPLLITAAISIIVSILQAATQLQEQTATFLIKVGSYAVALFFFAPAIARGAVRFTTFCFQSAASFAKVQL